MAKKNYLVEGVSGTGKSSVCDELQRRGYKAINGDKELAYQGDPETGNEQKLMVMSTTYGTLMKSEK
jgi:broad-specificity NMP kinase